MPEPTPRPVGAPGEGPVGAPVGVPPVEAPPVERTFYGADPYADLAPAAADAAAPYLALPPGPALGRYVARLHVCRERVAPGTAVHERVLPDGAASLQLHLGDPPALVADAAPLAGAPAGGGWAAEATGPTAAAAVVRLAGRVEGVSVQLRPGAALALLGVPAGELAGQSVPLDALWAADAQEALDRAAAVPHGPARAAAVERVLLARLARLARRAGRQGAGDPSRAVRAALRHVEAADGRVAVRDLAAAVGVGERRLEQLFHAHVGLTPKAACRLARFHASVRLARRRPALGWSDVAYACGFADQAHLAHEYRAISGLTPGAFRARFAPPPDFGILQDAPAARR